MSPASFRFEQLIQLYRTQCDTCRYELASAAGAHARSIEYCRHAQKQLELAAQSQRESLAGMTRIESLQHWHRYQQSLQKAVDDAQLVVLEAARGVEQRREQLQQAERRLKTVQKLAERQLTAWRSEQARRETRQLDEAAARCRMRVL